MKIILLTAGTGSYHCGVCMRDNALAKELIRMGHQAVLLPMYLPLTLDDENAPSTPIFFGGVSTYLREKWSIFRRMPRWLDRLLSARWLLKLVAGKAAAQTGGPEVAEMTLSMLRGEQGNQAGEIDELLKWLRVAFDGRPPDAIWISTALQAGLARRLRGELGVPIIGSVQGEDTFIDGLGEPAARVWALLAERMQDVQAWVAPSDYFAHLMIQRLGWCGTPRATDVRIIPNGIAPEAYTTLPEPERPTTPTIGFLARLLQSKGLGLLVEAFILLRQRIPEVQLRVAGSMTAHDAKYVDTLKARLEGVGLGQAVRWQTNVSLEEKVAFLRSLTVFSVPASYSEASGQYLFEALAAGTPVVQPRASAFPEIVEATHGGVLFDFGQTEAESAKNLADALEPLLRDPERARFIGDQGRASVQREFTVRRLAERLVALTSSFSGGPGAR